MRRTVHVAFDVRLSLPFGIGEDRAALPRSQQLLGNAPLLRDHQCRAFRFPDTLGSLGLRRIDLDMNEADDRHDVLLAFLLGAIVRREWLRLQLPKSRPCLAKL